VLQRHLNAELPIFSKELTYFGLALNLKQSNNRRFHLNGVAIQPQAKFSNL